MKYLIVLLLLIGCGIKPSASCTVDLKDKETLDEIKAECLENPKIGIKKEF
jgi:hypothetical protein